MARRRRIVAFCLAATFLIITRSYSHAGETTADITKGIRQGSTPNESAFKYSISDYNIWCLREKVTLQNDHSSAQIRFVLQRGYNVADYNSPLLEPRDLTHLKRMRLLTKISDNATKGATTQEEKADRLFQLVAQEMSPYADGESYDMPEEMLLRGYGSCDQISWALCALASQTGFPSMVIFLRNSPDAKSHHSIAAIRVNEKWLLYDPFSNIIYPKKNGEHADLISTIKDKGHIDLPRKNCSNTLLNPATIAFSSFNIYTEPRGILPRWGVFSSKVQSDKTNLRLFFSPVQHAQDFITELAQALETPPEKLSTAYSALAAKNSGKEMAKNISPQVMIYGDPFKYYRLLSSTKADSITQKRISGKLRAARIESLTGNQQKAIQELSQLKIKPAKNQCEKTETLFFLSRTYAAMGNRDKALSIMKNIEKTSPKYKAAIKRYSAYNPKQNTKNGEVVTTPPQSE